MSRRLLHPCVLLLVSALQLPMLVAQRRVFGEGRVDSSPSLTVSGISGGQEEAISTVAMAQMVAPYGTAIGPDEDKDGILDTAELALAERFAPIIVHDRDDLNLPANVDWLLKRTSLEFYGNNGLFRKDQHLKVKSAPMVQEDLIGLGLRIGQTTISSDGVRSKTRQHTYVLSDVESAGDRAGSLDSADWVTYVHSFRNTFGGISIQYWRCYAYNTGDQTATLPIEFDHHGGDWEAVEVVLDPDLKPIMFKYPGHTTIETVPTAQVKLDGDHVVVYSEPGGHASHTNFNRQESVDFGPAKYNIWLNDLNDPVNTIRQETWTGGKVTWPTAGWRSHKGGLQTATGALRNIGEKQHPLNGQVFVRYSGLWGSMGVLSSGYWGPAYNETQLGSDGLIRTWCSDMAPWKDDPNRYRAECYANRTVP